MPKAPPPPIDWEKIARSGRVWEFIEGEDFTGKVGSFRARSKTAARKCGVDFDSAEVERDGKVVLKVLARAMDKKDEAAVEASGEGAERSDTPASVVPVA